MAGKSWSLIKVKPFSNLKSSDRRRLLSAACQTFGLDESSIPGSAKLNIVPKDVRSAKMIVHSGEKGTLYVDANRKPTWIKLDDGYLIPTLFTAWTAPYLLPRVCTVKHTLERLQNGANLMIPGIFDPLPDLSPVGSIVGISLLDSPNVPVALGVCLVDCSAGKLDTTQKGVAVQVINVVDDKLFDICKHRIPVPDDLDVSLPQPDSDVHEDESAAEQDNELAPSEPIQTSQESIPTSAFSQDTTESAQAVEEQANGPKAEVSQEADTPEEEPLSVDVIDDAFKKGLLQTLRKAIDTPLEYPIPSSTFLSNHVLQNLPYNHPSVVMKKTSWKRASKFFKAMEKQGLVKCRERGGDLIILSGAGKDLPEIGNFQVFKAKSYTRATSKVSSEDSGTPVMDAKQYYKPRSMAAPLFAEAKLSISNYYTAEQLRQVVNHYITNHNLVEPKSPKTIRLDPLLVKAFGLSQTVQSVGRDKVVPHLQDNCSVFHTIATSEVPDPKMGKGPIPKVNLATARRGGNKIITTIENLEPFHINPVIFAEELRVLCAGSTSVNPVKEGSELRQILVQGNQIVTITKALEAKGVRNAWIEAAQKGTKR